MKISVVMIVKNEEVLLGRCLDSVREADEIIICDTGSSDRTIEIASRYTDKVFTDYVWNDSYCDARNHAKGKATGDWILSIDADEYLHDFSAVRAAAAQAFQAVNCNLYSEGDRQWHAFPRLFKNASHIFWTEDIHNIPNVAGEEVGDVRITYGWSPAHQLDPDRSLRILEKSVRRDPANIRARFYLGREYWYRKRYEDCVLELGRYVTQSKAYSEKADAFLIMARAFWALRQVDDARDACLQAVALNPTWYEPCEFMAYATGLNSGDPRLEANAAQWLRMCATSTNENVLFFRPPGPETSIGRYPANCRVKNVAHTGPQAEPLTVNGSVVFQGTTMDLEPALL